MRWRGANFPAANITLTASVDKTLSFFVFSFIFVVFRSAEVESQLCTTELIKLSFLPMKIELKMREEISRACSMRTFFGKED